MGNVLLWDIQVALGIRNSGDIVLDMTYDECNLYKDYMISRRAIMY